MIFMNNINLKSIGYWFFFPNFKSIIFLSKSILLYTEVWHTHTHTHQHLETIMTFLSRLYERINPMAVDIDCGISLKFFFCWNFPEIIYIIIRCGFHNKRILFQAKWTLKPGPIDHSMTMFTDIWFLFVCVCVYVNIDTLPF